MKPIVRLGLVFALGAASACGNSTQEQQAAEIQKSAEQMTKGANDAARGANDLAKGLEAMARGVTAAVGGDPNVKPVDPVDFKTLMALLPEVAGWERSKPEGERMSMPVSFAQASARYGKGDSEVRAKITDSGFNQLLVAPLTMMLSTGYAKETSDGFEKATTIGSFPAFEKWDASDKRGVLTVFVNKRFILELEGSGMADNKELHSFLGRLDLKALGDLK